MDILKCTHAVSVTVLLATAPIVPAAAQSANAVVQDTSRQDVGTVFADPGRGSALALDQGNASG